MNDLFCNVALAVPLRTHLPTQCRTALRESVQPGSRVLVPFRNKSMVGVVTELRERAPEKIKIRDDFQNCWKIIPALTPALLELGHWISGYYLAPVGEVFRAMLPPITELRAQQQIVITDAGKRVVDESDERSAASS